MGSPPFGGLFDLGLKIDNDSGADGIYGNDDQQVEETYANNYNPITQTAGCFESPRGILFRTKRYHCIRSTAGKSNLHRLHVRQANRRSGMYQPGSKEMHLRRWESSLAKSRAL